VTLADLALAAVAFALGWYGYFTTLVWTCAGALLGIGLVGRNPGEWGALLGLAIGLATDLSVRHPDWSRRLGPWRVVAPVVGSFVGLIGVFLVMG
jgi:hypothetical protein